MLARSREAIPEVRVPPAVISLAALLVVLVVVLLLTKDPGLTQLQIRGTLQQVQAVEVRAAVEPYLSADFFAVDLDSVRAGVNAIPWVAQARVERVWPGAIAVRIWERTAYARWNENQALDGGMQVFSPKAGEIPLGLPQLAGSAGNEQVVAETFRRLQAALNNTPLMLSGLFLDPRGEWTARTVTGIELRLGQGVPDERMPMLLGGASRALGGRWSEVQYLDLRYTNGFSVGWREPATPGEQAK